jgi:arabinose-5-phosphate isomerase
MVGVRCNCHGWPGLVDATSAGGPRLRAETDLVVCSVGDLSATVVKEPSPLGLMPSASMAVMLAFSDAITLTLMEVKGVRRKDHGMHHHGERRMLI